MKKLFILMLAGLLLVACTENEAATNEDEKAETVEADVEEKPTQEELNEKLKEEAIEIDFVAANAEEIEQGIRVKATGEISVLNDDGTSFLDFTLTTEENDGFGMYSITGANTTETELADGQTVTVYGTYSGKDDLGFPSITATIVE